MWTVGVLVCVLLSQVAGNVVPDPDVTSTVIDVTSTVNNDLELTRREHAVILTKRLSDSLFRLQGFEVATLANPFPVEQHFRSIIEALLNIKTVDRSRVEVLRDRIFSSLLHIQTASSSHALRLDTLLSLLDRTADELPGHLTSRSSLDALLKELKQTYTEITSELETIVADVQQLMMDSEMEIFEIVQDVTDADEDVRAVQWTVEILEYIYARGHEQLTTILEEVRTDHRTLVDQLTELLEDLEE